MRCLYRYRGRYIFDDVFRSDRITISVLINETKLQYKKKKMSVLSFSAQLSLVQNRDYKNAISVDDYE